MKTRFNSPLSPDEQRLIADAFRRGEVCLFPTDTVYGLGCRADNAVGAATIYRLKGRPIEKSLPLLIGSWEQFNQYCAKIPPKYRKRLEKVWPGALTVVVQATDKARKLSFHCLKEGTVAVRMPNHPVLRYIIEKVGLPLASTSANKSGAVEALSLEMVNLDIRREVGVAWSEVIPNGQAIPSTVVDLTGAEPVVLREGAGPF